MNKIIVFSMALLFLYSCGNSKKSADSQAISDLTTFMSTSEKNRASDVRQFKQSILELQKQKSDETSKISAMEAKIDAIGDKTSNYTLESTESIRRELDEFRNTMASFQRKLSHLNYKLNKKIRMISRAANAVPQPTMKSPAKPKPAAVVAKAVNKPTVTKISRHYPKKAKPVLKMSEPKRIEPARSEPKAAEPKAAKAKVAEPKVVEPKVVEPNIVKTKVVEPKAVETKVVEPAYPEKPAYTEFKVEEPMTIKPVKKSSGNLKIEE